MPGIDLVKKFWEQTGDRFDKLVIGNSTVRNLRLQCLLNAGSDEQGTKRFNHALTLDCPNLEFLEVFDNAANVIDMTTPMLHLQGATMEFCCHGKWGWTRSLKMAYGRYLYWILERMPRATVLRLDEGYMRGLQLAKLQDRIVPAFKWLIRLDLYSHGLQGPLFLARFLRHCPTLRWLSLRKTLNGSCQRPWSFTEKDIVEDVWDAQKGILCALKGLTMDDFCCMNKGERALLKYVLTHCAALDELDITCHVDCCDSFMFLRNNARAARSYKLLGNCLKLLNGECYVSDASLQ